MPIIYNKHDIYLYKLLIISFNIHACYIKNKFRLTYIKTFSTKMHLRTYVYYIKN